MNVRQCTTRCTATAIRVRVKKPARQSMSSGFDASNAPRTSDGKNNGKGEFSIAFVLKSAIDFEYVLE